MDTAWMVWMDGWSSWIYLTDLGHEVDGDPYKDAVGADEVPLRAGQPGLMRAPDAAEHSLGVILVGPALHHGVGWHDV